MEKMKFETVDGTRRNIDKIAEMFPQVVTEVLGDDGKLKRAVKWDILKELLSGDYVEGGECYEFTWPGKRAAIAEAAKPIRKTLRPCKEESKNWDTTENLYIEGDNLEVLKLLQESYLGKVKMIYIDPPYNTGNDFVYKDNFTKDKDTSEDELGLFDEETDNRTMSGALFKNTEANGRFHSDWCSMMFSRMQIAYNLLSNDGVIFISLDDNEVCNFRKICDEIFGEENFYTQIIIQSNKRGQTYKQISKTHEYLLVYTKDIGVEFNELEKDGDSDDLNLLDNIGKFNIRELRNRNPKFGRHNRPNLYYPIFVNPNAVDCNGFSPVSIEKNDEFFVEIFPTNSEGAASCWRWGKDKTQQNCDSQTMNCNLVAKRKNTGSFNIYEKYRKTTYKPKSIWDDVSVITEKGTVELGELGLSAFFDFPKPLGLLYKMLQIGTNPNDIILDFFSGSATTSHAVMQLNAEDGGNRKFIMVQLPEVCEAGSEAAKAGYKNICEIGKERIRRAGEKIKQDAGLAAANLDIGFRVFKVADSNMKDVYYSASDYSQDMLDSLVSNIKEDRTDLDLLYGCLLEWGVELSLPHTSETIDNVTVHTVNNGDLIACFDANIPESAIRTIAKRQPLRAVFRDSSFASAPQKINVEEIFKLLSPTTTVKVI